MLCKGEKSIKGSGTQKQRAQDPLPERAMDGARENSTCGIKICKKRKNSNMQHNEGIDINSNKFFRRCII